MSSPYQLGASMYVPCDHPELKATFGGQKFPKIRSLIACTEDSITESCVASAVEALADAVQTLPPRGEGAMRFIRCRNVDILDDILRIPGIDKVDGFVLPKVDEASFPEYERVLSTSSHMIMPTLETVGVFDSRWQSMMCQRFTASRLATQVLALRIGGNDLLRHLGLRRMRGVTIYETPLGALIPQLVLAFRPHGFHLSAPVYDYFDDPNTLLREVKQDVLMGLVGKTAIHPVQAGIIDDALRVSRQDLEAANRLLEARGSDAAVFQHEGSMMELAVHSPWADQIIQRALAAGVA